jgi:hypothetical protein
MVFERKTVTRVTGSHTLHFVKAKLLIECPQKCAKFAHGSFKSSMHLPIVNS